jgi:hypothetical protein
VAILLLLTMTGASTADAATVTVGPDLAGAVGVNTFSCNVVGGCTYSQESPSYVSPVSGTIVRWRVLRGHGPLTLRVIDGNTGGASGETEHPASESLETFPADLPIQAGERIGVDLPAGFVSDVGVAQPTGFKVSAWTPSLVSGETRAPDFVYNEFELLLNADVQQPPGIESIAPASGPISGGTTVVIGGHDLTGASSVMFGGRPAAGFSVDSDTQITAASPPTNAAGRVTLAVTTVAGTATAQFNYEAPSAPPTTVPPATPPPVASCKVPKLKGAKLKASKRRARAADCKVGKVTKKQGVTSKSGEVIKQVPRPGSVVAAGTSITVRLG